MSARSRIITASFLVLLISAAVQAPERRAQAAEEARWVQNHVVTEQWSSAGPDAQFFGWLRRWSYLRVDRWEGERLYVYNPRTNNWAYVDASAVGPSGPPPSEYLEPTRVLEAVGKPARLVGTVQIYSEPSNDDGVWLRSEGHNTPVFVEARVKGDGDGVWYRLDSGEFVEGGGLRIPNGPQQPLGPKWIDVELSDPTIITAYEEDRVAYSALAIRGAGAWQTPTGVFRILRRVENETMSSEGLGIPRNAPGGYYLKNVLFTQYFLGSGESIHFNYWSSNFGYAGSHGCLGLNYDDALWLWQWSEVGTPVAIHY